MEIDYEEKYNEALERAKRLRDSKYQTMNAKRVVEEIFPQLAESEDEMIRKELIAILKASYNSGITLNNKKDLDRYLAYLEKQKDASKAIEVVDRIDKYIDENVANAHDMKDSNPNKEYYLGWDDALSEMAGILQDVYSNEKQKESLHITETCKENADSFTDACKDVIVAIKKYLDWLTGYPDYAPKGKYSIRDMLYCLSLLEKQKPENVSATTMIPSCWEVEQKEQKPVLIAENDNWYICIKDFYAGGKKWASVGDLVQAKNGMYMMGRDDISEWFRRAYYEDVRDAFGPNTDTNIPEQKPAEWSKVDEAMLDSIIAVIEDWENEQSEKEKEYYGATSKSDWLKSLRPPQYCEDCKLKRSVENWKPSEEQMEALNALNCHGDLSYVGQQKQLISLYNDLKKQI